MSKRTLEMECCEIIFLYTVKRCHSDWFNKKLNGQQLGRIWEQRGCWEEQSQEEWSARPEEPAWAVQSKVNKATKQKNKKSGLIKMD